MKINIQALNNRGIAHIILILGIIVIAGVLITGFKVVQHNRSDKSSVSVKQGDKTATQEQLTADAAALDSLAVTTPQTGATKPQPGTGPASSTPTKNSTSTPQSSPIQGPQPSNSSSTPPSTSVDSDTPQVTLTYPSYWGQTVSGTITLTATASDSSGIQKVVFMIRRIGYATPVYTQTDTTAPYSTTFNTTTLPNGGSEYTVEAQAFDTAGTGNLASYRINIQN